MLKQRIEAVTKANQRFYEAFESLDIVKMDEVWTHQEYVTCIHPGWTIRSGWPAVRDSWVLIFNNTFSMKFELSDIMVQVPLDVTRQAALKPAVMKKGIGDMENEFIRFVNESRGYDRAAESFLVEGERRSFFMTPWPWGQSFCPI